MMKHLLLLLSIIVYYIEVGTSLYCYWNTGCPYKYVTSKTPYNAVRGDIRDSIINIKGCEPISIWATIRYGKRYPSVYSGKHMEESIVVRDYVLSSYEKGNSTLCAQDVDYLRDWRLNNKMFREENNLADEGSKEMIDLGSRLKQAFPKLLSNLKENAYTFRPANGHWIEKSAAGFVKGLKEDGLKIDNSISGYDIVAPYTTCEKYINEVRENKHTYDEVHKYMRSSDYLVVKDRIERRTGIVNILTDENISALYDLCRYTWSGIDSKSPWCALFTTEDLMVLEYFGDLKHYYRSGYGHPLNEKFGQITLTDLLKSFKLAKEGKGNAITAYFSHATMLDMIYVALGLFQDEQPLTAAHRNPDRKWRISKSSAFSANLIAVLNKCTKNDATDYNVVFYLNEEPIMSLCKEGVCTWKEFEDKLSSFVNTTMDFCELQTVPEK